VSTARLQAALEEFRRRHPRDPTRQRAIQHYCVEELEARGISGASTEVVLPGSYRNKVWDVGLVVDGEARLGISCKSIIANHAGTVPNRIDDLLGEAVNLHRRSPNAVIGYLFMMARVDESQVARRRRERLAATMEPDAVLTAARASGDAWFEQLGESVSRASGRRDAADFPEKFEAVSCSLFDFDQPSPFPVRYHGHTSAPAEFFDVLAAVYRQRYESAPMVGPA
jgi:Restriction endonuclease XhoI